MVGQEPGNLKPVKVGQDADKFQHLGTGNLSNQTPVLERNQMETVCSNLQNMMQKHYLNYYSNIRNIMK